MSFEKYYGIYKTEEGTLLKAGKEPALFEFSADAKENKRYKLFVVGETSQFYWWKNEPNGSHLYTEIADALDYENAGIDRFSLDFSAKEPFTYIKRVYKKVLWPPVAWYIPVNPLPTMWKAGIRVKAENLVIHEGGFLQMRFEIRLKRDGVSRRDVTVPSDKTVILSVPQGTYDYKELAKEISVPENTANICVFVEGKNYSGRCWFEHPMLSADAHNMLPPFTEPASGKSDFDWTGQFISRKQYPEFRVVINGEQVFRGEIFERVHRHSEWEIALPKELLKKENELAIQLISSYRNPLPYTVYELALLEQPDSPVDILSVSEFAPIGGFARVLIRTKENNTTLAFSCESDAVSGNAEYHFAEKGLHGITLPCHKAAQNVVFTLTADGFSAKGTIGNIIHKEEDKVITGTGDMVYIPQENEAMEEFLSWYISQGIGDFVTMRPCYRWSGTKQLEADSVKRFARLMNELKIKYVLMVDGREVPGLNAQPDAELLAGKNYLGRQAHERDGAIAYWGERIPAGLAGEQAQELMFYAWQEDKEHTGERYSEKGYVYKDEQLFLYDYKRDLPHDYAEGHKHTMAVLENLMGKQTTRHTGPSCLFRHFAEHGHRWLGAETMYSSMEILMGFLRGAAKDYGIHSFGVHHAVQWSSTPHDTEERYRRFRLALYTSYMTGATDINTEEGLWHLEEGYEHFHRFSDACKGHLKKQQDFYRFTASHTRSGKLYSPVALIHGRDDGINFFTHNKIWGMDIPFTSAEKSWELSREIYPLSVPATCLYFHKCPADRPVGFYSGTPFGNMDVIPAEGKPETLKDYKLLVYLGYNHLTKEDGKKLLAYIENGGKVLLTRAHLTSTTDIEKVRRGELEFANNPFKLDGEEGALLTKQIGKGTLYVFNTNAYPYDIREQYAETMKQLIKEVQDAEPVWAQAGNDVAFSCYKQENGNMHIYFLAVDWYNKGTESRPASLKVGEHLYQIGIPFGVMIKVVSSNTVAVWPESEQGEVLELSENGATLQGRGTVPFCIAKDGRITRKEIDFSQNGTAKIEF